MQIGVEDELIMAAQTKLATFSAVSNETARMSGIFDRATAAAFDLAATGFGDASSASVQLGKALQDPIRGITALRKSGVSFTEAEQAKIKALTQSGKLLEAQNIILTAVEKQVGGVAAASAPATQKMAVAFGEVGESIGKVLLPVIEEFAHWMTGTVIPAFQKFVEEHPGVVKAIAVIAGALIGFGVAVKVVTTAIKIMSIVMSLNPIVAISMAIIAAATAIIYYWQKIKDWFSSFGKGWGKYWDIMMIPIMPFIFIPKVIIKYWSQIKGFFGDMFGWMQQKATDVVNWWFQLPFKLYDAGVNIVTSIWEGMKSAWNGMIDWFSDGLQSMRNMLPFSPAKTGPLRDIHRIKLMETIAMSIKPNSLTTAMTKTTQAAKNALFNTASASPGGSGGSTSITSNRSTGLGVTINYAPVVNLAGGVSSDKESFMSMLKNHEAELARMFRDLAAQQARKSFA